MIRILLLFLFGLCHVQGQAQSTTTKAVPVFENGEAQIVEAFSDYESWLRHDLWVETDFDTDGDGLPDRMHVSVTRPPQTENEGLKLPVIYVTSPYFAGVAGFQKGLFWDVQHELGEAPPTPRVHPEVKRQGERPIISNSHIETWVPRGYIVVHSSSPGTGLSQGAPTVGGDNESLAPKAVIEWLSGKDNGYTEPYGGEKVMAYWSTGKVGMTGTSYNGTLPLAAATTGVEGLEAIIPIAPNTSYYHYYRSNGLIRHPGGYLGEDIDVLYDFIHSGDTAKRAYNNRVVRDSIMARGMDRITGDYNAFWAERDYLNEMEPMKAALLMSHGFNDWNVMPEHSYRIYDAARSKGLPVQVFYHQNGHGGPPPLTLRNRWFTRYLHGVENGVEADPRSWIVREGERRDNPTPYPDYPHPDAEMVKLFPLKGGNAMGTLTTRQSKMLAREQWTDDVTIPGDSLARLSSSDHRLLYQTPELKQDLHLSGTARIKVKMSSSKSACNLSVWLVSLPWNEADKAPITDNIITRGWADLQNRNSLTTSEPLEPGTFYEMTFDLQPDDQIIPAGQRIALMIFSSDRDFTIWPEPGTELVLEASSSWLSLPVVGGNEALRSAFE